MNDSSVICSSANIFLLKFKFSLNSFIQIIHPVQFTQQQFIYRAITMYQQQHIRDVVTTVSRTGAGTGAISRRAEEFGNEG